MNRKTIEDLERAAWYARLAFGVYQDKPISPPATSKKAEVTFNVLP